MFGMKMGIADDKTAAMCDKLKYPNMTIPQVNTYPYLGINISDLVTMEKEMDEWWTQNIKPPPWTIRL